MYGGEVSPLSPPPPPSGCAIDLLYVVILNSAASLLLPVTGKPVKIQTGPMTMIDTGNEEETLWGRLWEQCTKRLNSWPQETPMNITEGWLNIETTTIC